jgi:gliding motility-associated-like protein
MSIVKAKSIRSFRVFLVSILLFLFVISSQTATAQSSNKGLEFWIGFPNHAEGTQAGLYLYITGDSNTTGTVSVPGQSWSTTFSVTANAMTLVAVPSSIAYMSCADCKEKKGIKVVAAKKVVVYSHIYRKYRSDATLVLPTRTLGKKYYCMSYEQLWTSERSQFMIIAAKDNTKIKITPSVALAKSGGGSRAAGSTYEITLNQGECYQGRANSSGATQDVSGTLIEVIDTGSTANCRTVAVFSGSSGTHLGCDNRWSNSRDNLYQQMYPIKSWGQRFITVPFKGMNGDDVRVLASEDNSTVTVINKTGAPVNYYLDKGEHKSLEDVKDETYIVCDKPIMVAQYQQSQRCNSNSTGDPSMTILNPIEQTLKKITVYSSEYEDITKHYINVIIPSAGVSSFRIDGNTASFTKVAKYQAYSYAQITVTKGNHQMSSNVGFNAVAYGFGRYESYGYSAGANVKDLTAVAELENSAKNDEITLCLGQVASFKGTAEYTAKRWHWEFGDGDTSSTQSPKHTYRDTGLYEVKLKVFKPSDDGCSIYDSSVMEVKVNAPPVAKLHFESLCEDQSIRFDDSTFTPVGEKQLFSQFTFHDNTNVYAKFANKTYDSSGKYYIRLISGTENQCRDTFIDSIFISPTPVASFDVDNACSLDTSEFINNSSVKLGGISTNKWFFGDGDSSSIASPKHLYLDSGTYAIQLDIVSDSGCKASAYDTIIKYEKYSIDFTYSDTCAGLTVDLTNISASQGGSLQDWKWKFHDGTTATSKDTSYKYAVSGSYDVWLVGSLDTVCRDSVLHTITVDPNIAADFWFTSNCLVDTITFTNSSTITGGTLAESYWDFDDGLTSTLDTVKVNYASKGSKDIQLIAVSDQGCRDTSTLSIIIYNPKIIGFNIPNICQNRDDNIVAIMDLDGDSIVTWDWTADGTKYTTDTVKLNYSSTGRYEITLNAISKNNCEMSYLDSFNIYATPDADFTIAPVCIGEDLEPVNLSSIEAGENITGYNWYVNNNLESSLQDPVLSGAPVGTNTIRLNVTSSTGCPGTKVLTVEVYPLPVPSFTHMDTCFGDNTTFTSGATIASGSITSEDWIYDDGTTTSGSVISRFLPSPAEYSLKLIVTSTAGCKDSISRSFSIAPLPFIDIIADPISGCQPLMVAFTNNSSITSGTITQYNFDFGDGNTSTTMSPSNEYQSTGSFTVTVDALSAAGCRDTLVLANPIDVLPKPVAAFSFSPDEPSLLEPAIQFVNESTPDAITFNWSITDGTTHTGPVVDHTLEPGDYIATLIAIAANGCSDTTERNIHVKLDFFLHAPSAFSPNGDFINDMFGINGMVAEVQGYTMTIFNTWGEQVFSSANPIEKWDGTINGKEPHIGTYMYIVRYQNIETQRWETINGVVHIIR